MVEIYGLKGKKVEIYGFFTPERNERHNDTGGRQRDGLMCSKEDQLRDHLHAPEGPRQRHSRNDLTKAIKPKRQMLIKSDTDPGYSLRKINQKTEISRRLLESRLHKERR
ncbi:hypothetical protein RB195_007769 [Necator americanus]|uniref:Uncharacterized protein n=1 Tax=Necator americanus TaxID=51031 RepID=A0ABR1BYV7_NECAM